MRRSRTLNICCVPLPGHNHDPGSGVSESHSMCGLVPDVPSTPQSRRAVTQITQFWGTLSFLLPAFLLPSPSPFLPSCLSSSLSFYLFPFFASLFVPSASLHPCPCPSLSLLLFFQSCTWQSFQSWIFISYCQSGRSDGKETQIF